MRCYPEEAWLYDPPIPARMGAADAGKGAHTGEGVRAVGAMRMEAGEGTERAVGRRAPGHSGPRAGGFTYTSAAAGSAVSVSRARLARTRGGSERRTNAATPPIGSLMSSRGLGSESSFSLRPGRLRWEGEFADPRFVDRDF